MLKKRLIMDLPVGIHTQIKELAYLYNITITKYVTAAIMKSIKEDINAPEAHKRATTFIKNALNEENKKN